MTPNMDDPAKDYVRDEISASFSRVTEHGALLLFPGPQCLDLMKILKNPGIKYITALIVVEKDPECLRIIQNKMRDINHDPQIPRLYFANSIDEIGEFYEKDNTLDKIVFAHLDGYYTFNEEYLESMLNFCDFLTPSSIVWYTIGTKNRAHKSFQDSYLKQFSKHTEKALKLFRPDIYCTLSEAKTMIGMAYGINKVTYVEHVDRYNLGELFADITIIPHKRKDSRTTYINICVDPTNSNSGFPHIKTNPKSRYHRVTEAERKREMFK